MPKIIRTTKDERHWHIAFVRDDGSGYTSVDSEHAHNIDREVIEDPVMNPDTGQTMQKAVLGASIIEEANGHIHELGEIELVEPVEEEDSEVVGDVLEMWKQVKDIEMESKEIAGKAEGYYSGDGQWDEGLKRNLQSVSRAALVLNEIEPKIDLLSGFHRQNRLDIRYLPVEGSDQMGADILNIVVKNILNQNGFEMEETEVFDDMLIAGRGSFNFYTDYDANIDGDIIVEHFNWQDAFYGPHNKKNI